MKRQRGRGRGGGGGGKPQQQNANRAFDSNGPDGVKVRGNAQTVFEKYQQLARDANASGDRVLGENYLQHAEHYFRLLRALQPQRPASEILGRDQFASGYDIDFEDEGGQAQAEAADDSASDGEAEGEGRWQGRDDRQRDDRPRDDRSRDDRRDRYEGQGGQGQGRDQFRDGGRRDRWRDRDDRNRNQDRGQDRGPDRYGERAERGGDDRPQRERFERRDERPEREPVAVSEAPPMIEERPSQVLRDAEGGESHAPAFLQAPAAAPRSEEGEDEAPARRPRRRRAPRSFEAGEGPGEGEAS
jgi:hypothetical protein